MNLSHERDPSNPSSRTEQSSGLEPPSPRRYHVGHPPLLGATSMARTPSGKMKESTISLSGLVKVTPLPKCPSPRRAPSVYGSTGTDCLLNCTSPTIGIKCLAPSVCITSPSVRTRGCAHSHAGFALALRRAYRVWVSQRCSSQHSVEAPSLKLTRYIALPS